MEEENRVANLSDFSLNMLLTAVFNWSYENDLVLYRNLDSVFEAFRCRNAISPEQSSQMSTSKIFKTYTAFELLVKALEQADFQDTLKFRRTFEINNNSTNKGHGSYDWKYSSFTPHPYSELLPLIKEHMSSLEEKGLCDWHKSENHGKHYHFRYWINRFLTEKTHFSLRLFVLETGNVKTFDTLHIGSNDSDSEVFKIIMQYILDRNICPDPHYAKLEVPDYVNPDHHNPRYLTKSGTFGGFNYLVYLTGSELKEIYKTKLNKRKLNYLEKTHWGFINASSTDKETKYFLFIT
jgi:hypothetical protein